MDGVGDDWKMEWWYDSVLDEYHVDPSSAEVHGVVIPEPATALGVSGLILFGLLRKYNKHK